MHDLDTLRVFLRVAETASFTRAADDLGLRKGRVSLVIRNLETSLGARLLHRTTRAVQMTEEGRALYDRAHELLGAFGELQTMFSDSEASLQGRLRVDLPTELASSIVMPAVPEFLASHPGLELQISCTDRRVDLVQEGFDCVLRAGVLGDDTLIARHLGKMPVSNFASPAYLQSARTPMSLEDLQSQGHRMIHYVSHLGNAPFGWEYPQGSGYAFLPMAGAITVNSVQAYLAAGLAGAGLMQAPLIGLAEHLQSGRLIEILPDSRPEPIDLWLVVAHRHNLSRRVRAFMAWVEALFEPHLIRDQR
ncbi:MULTISPECIES: LysR family transcriptional regulator [Stenotrophomonas]|uniref:LysR family transcriptional regulator n=1 Tax=Stenotrophomonas maltophilia TaxID=40324 RepID=A0A431UE71_STEMA|nr:LysR family transcriptional regulator [Stenotrophomonas maltophilia]RTQ87831.1 LysR family transcriptional regulator [Stenotrophomonas maltophilia]